MITINRTRPLKTIYYLSIMYFCWGMASSMVFSLLPIFIVEDLHGSLAQFGLIEGIVVFCSFISKLFAGLLIDIFKRKINILYLGTISTVFSKILLAFANSILFVFIAKSIDRIAKGLRHAPVDAIFAELTEKKGYIYSLRYAINVFGSFTGSILTSQLVLKFGHEFRLIFILACIPTIISLYILVKKVKYKDKIQIKRQHIWKLSYIKHFSKEYWQALVLITLVMLNRFSEGFITLRANDIISHSINQFPFYMAIYELCAVSISIPMGKLSDKINKYLVIFIGLFVLFIADILGILATNKWQIITIYILCGIHMGTTHSLLTSIIAKIAPKELIGTAFALYYGIDAIVLLITNHFAGSIGIIINKYFGISVSAGPFIWGTFTSIIAMIYSICLIKRKYY